MEGHLKLRKGDCYVAVTECYVSVERDGTAFIADAVRPVCNVYRVNRETNTVRFKIYNFEAVASNGETEIFTVNKGNWTVELHRSVDAQSHAFDLFEDGVFTATLEWKNNHRGLGAFVYGDPMCFVRFVEETIDME